MIYTYIEQTVKLFGRSTSNKQLRNGLLSVIQLMEDDDEVTLEEQYIFYNIVDEMLKLKKKG